MSDTQNENNVMNAGTLENKEEKRLLRFIGSYSHSLDSKGRLVIPQGFREQLGETFYIAPSFDFQSVAIYPTEKWEERAQSYDRLGGMNPALNRYREQFFALSYKDQTCDAQGRMLLPANIRQRILHEERDMEITGANDHVRVAAMTASEDIWNKFKDELRGLMEMIAELETKKE